MATPTWGLLATGFVAGDDGFTQLDVAQAIQTGRLGLAVLAQERVKFDQLALEGLLVRNDLDGTPRAGCASVTALEGKFGWHVAQEWRRERERKTAEGA